MVTDASEAGAIAALSALNSAALAQAPNPIGGVTSDGPKISSDAITMNPPAANVVATNHQSAPAMNMVATNQLAADLQQSQMFFLLASQQAAQPTSQSMGLLKRPRSDQPCKQGWTKKEDEIILRTVREVGTKWSRIARELPGRSDDAVRNRYIRIQRKPTTATTTTAEMETMEGDEGGAPKDVVTSKRGDMWTASEDEAVLRGVNEHGLKWQVISESLQGRSINAVRNRYLRLAPPQQQQLHQQQLQQQQQQQQQHSHQQAVATPLIVSGAGMVSLALGRTVGA